MKVNKANENYSKFYNMKNWRKAPSKFEDKFSELRVIEKESFCFTQVFSEWIDLYVSKRHANCSKAFENFAKNRNRQRIKLMKKFWWQNLFIYKCEKMALAKHSDNLECKLLHSRSNFALIFLCNPAQFNPVSRLDLHPTDSASAP